jgi:hypothetical protein
VIGAAEARRIAQMELSTVIQGDDAQFAPLRDAIIGDPVLVRTVFGEPSYWMAPACIAEHVAGFVRILGSGRVASVGTFCTNPSRLASCPAIVTGIDRAEAARRAAERIRIEEGDVALEPVYVHDGPYGREAWLVAVRRHDRPDRWIFVTAAFTYERPSGEMRDTTRE